VQSQGKFVIGLVQCRAGGDLEECAAAALEREIDRLVYWLYDLTPEEIKLVEGAGQNKK